MPNKVDLAFLEEALKQLDMLGRPLLIHCRCCNCYHRKSFSGDCRNDSERYAGPYGERK